MLKEKAFRKIIISLSCLGILGIIYLFPNTNEQINMSITKKVIEDDTIYLKDNNDYISRVGTILKSTTKEDKIKEIISFLTIGSDKL